MSQQIDRLPGMHDSFGEAIERLRETAESIGAFLQDQSYTLIDTPILEETELFVRKSGGEMTSRLYSFSEPGGRRVSLRPEFTPSVIRYFLQERNSVTLPVRWWYTGPVFRYEQSENGGYQQFTQLGAELVGSGGVEADAEVIRLAVDALRHIGLEGLQLKVGHLGALHGILDSFQLSEPAKLFILGNVQTIKTVETGPVALTERAADLGILGGNSGAAARAALSEMTLEGAQEFVKDVLSESLPLPIGRRSTEQIVARLLRKVGDADDPKVFAAALEVTREIVSLDGPPETVVREARRVASSHGIGDRHFDELESLFALVHEADATLDLGHARGIAYYTGVIFDLSHAGADGSDRLLGGGGRYDELVRVLGGDENAPAAGFACTLEQVVACLSVSASTSQASVAS